MIAEAKQFAPKETGGVFMGYRARDSIVITNVIGSGPNAVHQSVFYRPDLQYEETQIAKAYAESKRMHTYLGDWHTHPSGILRLSRKDKIALATIAKSKEARIERPIMAILAGENDDWRCHVWEYISRLISLMGPTMRSMRLKMY